MSERVRAVLSRPIDISLPWRAVRDHPDRFLLGLGVFFRVVAYLWNRPYWLDEATLMGNVNRVPIFEFSGYLRGDQLAPFGYLIVERCVVNPFGVSGYVTRFLPLVCGLASLWLFKALAQRWLSARAALVALALFAFSDDLVYYASEAKPYSSDVMVCLAVLLAASNLTNQPAHGRRLAMLGLLAVACPWLSFPSSFVVAGCGAALILDRLARRSWVDLAWLLVLAGCWLISFALAYRAAHALLHPATTMYVFWDFAFPPIPPRDLAAVRKLVGILLEVFVNPLNLVSPLAPAPALIVPVVLLVAGGFSLARREWPVFLCLAVPIVLALAAGALRRYPFHGRLVLGLLPSFYLLIPEGVDRVRQRIGRRLAIVTLILLLFHPCTSTIYELTGRRERYFNSHGDLHDNVFME